MCHHFLIEGLVVKPLNRLNDGVPMDIVWIVTTDQSIRQYFWTYAAARRFADQNGFRPPVLGQRPQDTPVA